MRTKMLNDVIQTCKSECNGNALLFDLMFNDFKRQVKLTHEEFMYITQLAQTELSKLK